MSFLESIQHGLEKATQEASRIAKIQHLHNVTTDLNFKSSQQGQNLVSKAMEMYHQGILAQGELTAICKQIDDYQQQMAEVQAELQKLQSPDDDASQQAAPPIPQVPGAYPAYPQAVPGTVPPGYPAYPAPPAGYPAYPAQAAYPGYPPIPAGYPAYPGVPVQPPVAPASEPPTQPLTAPTAAPAPAETQPAPHKAHHHAAAKATPEAAAPTAEPTEQAAPLAGTYANGVLPPVFSPFANNPATTTPDAAPADGSEAAKPKAHHSTKKAAASAEDAPAKD